MLNKSDLVHPRDRLLETTDEIMDRAQEIMDQIDKEREGNGASTDGGGGVGGAPDFPCTSSSTEIAPKQRAKKGMRATSGSDDDCAAVGDDRCDKSKSSSSNSSKSSTITSSRGSVEGQRPLFRDGGKSVDDHVTVFMISAKAGHGVQDVVDFLVHRARPGPWLFGKDETTNIDKRSRVKEIVREGLYKHLYKELPYQITTHTRYDLVSTSHGQPCEGAPPVFLRHRSSIVCGETAHRFERKFFLVPGVVFLCFASHFEDHEFRNFSLLERRHGLGLSLISWPRFVNSLCGMSAVVFRGLVILSDQTCMEFDKINAAGVLWEGV